MSRDLASLTGVAGRYAAALFGLANDEGALKDVEADLVSLGQAIDSSKELRDFLRSPVYGRDDQRAAMKALAKEAGFHKLTKNFLKLVANNRRLFALEGMIKAFGELAAQHRGEVFAEAVSASALNDDQVKALRLEIEASVGAAVKLETRVDPDLLGGLIVKVGSRMIDASLKTKLNRLKTAMKEA